MKIAELNATIEKYLKIRTGRLALDKQSSTLKAEEDMLRGIVLREMKGRPNPVYEAGKLKAELKMRAYANVTDWAAVQKHILATGEFDLLQKRLTVTAVRERWEVGKDVPGVEQAQEAEVIITRVKS